MISDSLVVAVKFCYINTTECYSNIIMLYSTTMGKYVVVRVYVGVLVGIVVGWCDYCNVLIIR